ncbi:unnamed protein product [Calypogeia fissa]
MRGAFCHVGDRIVALVFPKYPPFITGSSIWTVTACEFFHHCIQTHIRFGWIMCLWRHFYCRLNKRNNRSTRARRVARLWHRGTWRTSALRPCPVWFTIRGFLPGSHFNLAVSLGGIFC